MTVSKVKILIESAERPASTARRRMSSVTGLAASGLFVRMNMASAFEAAKWRPRPDAPAWKITGVRCGEGSHRWKPGTL